MQINQQIGRVVNYTPLLFYPRQRDRYPLYSKLGGPQGRSHRLRKICPPSEFDPRDRSARSKSSVSLIIASKPKTKFSNDCHIVIFNSEIKYQLNQTRIF